MQEWQIKISVLFIAVFMYGLYMVKLLTRLYGYQVKRAFAQMLFYP